MGSILVFEKTEVVVIRIRVIVKQQWYRTIIGIMLPLLSHGVKKLPIAVRQENIILCT